jgi:hypothetical protein
MDGLNKSVHLSDANEPEPYFWPRLSRPDPKTS